jgi:methylphosphotriester-DNA--protein-cysteine methyltransferase
MLAVQTLSHASALGAWTFHECRPAALRASIESIWEVEGTVTHTRERIFPNGRIDVLVNLGPPQRIVEGEGLTRFETTCVSGLQMRPLVVESMRETHVFGMRFRAESAYALLAAPLDGLRGRLVELPDLLGAAARALAERLAAAPSFAERARLACRWVEEQRGRTRPVSPYVAWIASEIEATNGAARIGALRRRAGVSPKKLAADFREQIGVTPKLLARLTRFRLALALLQEGGSLADAALSAGYYDQSHLALDFRELGGLTPREFIASRYPDGTSAVA